MRPRRSVMLLCLLLGACGARLDEIGREPKLAPVGDGMRAETTASIVAPPRPQAAPDRYSLWPEGKDSMFHDQRARATGDVVTIIIQINDWASLDNTSKRSRGAELSGHFGAEYALDDKASGASEKFTSGGKGSTGSDSNFTGKGSIARSEKIRLAIAAVITRVLPNGNFIVSGSQEVRVNHELRVLRVAGIVRPEDISQENTIAYDKIAEARISYGGRGRISEVQQPGWGQQIWDLINPF